MNFEPKVSYQVMMSRNARSSYFTHGPEINDEREAIATTRRRRKDLPFFSWALVEIIRQRVEL